MTTPVLNQDAFRGRNDDDTEADATWIVNTDTDWTQAVSTNFRIRFLVSESAGGMSNNQLLTPQYNHNGGGWTALTTSSNVIQATGSVHFTDEDQAFQKLGSGTYVDGRMDDDAAAGEGGTFDLQSNEVEAEFCLTIVAADVADADTIQVRLIHDSSTVFSGSYTIPVVHVSEPDIGNDEKHAATVLQVASGAMTGRVWV